MEHQHLVQFTINKYFSGGYRAAKRAGVEPEDLFQTGMIGLLKAIKRFNPNHGTTFSTYAVSLIKGEIRNMLRDSFPSGIKFSRDAIRGAYLIRKSDIDFDDIKDIQNYLQVNTELAREISNYLIHPQSFNPECHAPTYPNTEESAIQHVMVEHFYQTLTQNQQTVCKLYIQGKTQAEIGQLLNMSQVQVSRIWKRVLTRLNAQ